MPLSQISSRLEEMLIGFSRQPGFAAVLERLPKERVAPLAQVRVGGETYCLMRLPPALLRTTDRQRRIIQLVAAGLSNKVIARELGITPATVASHLNRIFRKFSVESRAALATYDAWLSQAGPGRS